MKERASRSRIKFFVPFIVLLILLSSFVVTIFSSEYSQFTGKPAPVSSSWLTYTIKVYHITVNPTDYGYRLFVYIHEVLKASHHM